MIWSIYFGFIAIGNNSGYNSCLEDPVKFLEENPDMNVFGVWDLNECNDFKDARDLFLMFSMPFVFLAAIKQQHNVWKNDKKENLLKYNPTQPLMFYVLIMLICAVGFIGGIWYFVQMKGGDWLLIIGIFFLPLVTGGIFTSALKRYWALKEQQIHR